MLPVLHRTNHNRLISLRRCFLILKMTFADDFFPLFPIPRRRKHPTDPNDKHDCNHRTFTAGIRAESATASVRVVIHLSKIAKMIGGSAVAHQQSQVFIRQGGCRPTLIRRLRDGQLQQIQRAKWISIRFGYGAIIDDGEIPILVPICCCGMIHWIDDFPTQHHTARSDGHKRENRQPEMRTVFLSRRLFIPFIPSRYSQHEEASAIPGARERDVDDRRSFQGAKTIQKILSRSATQRLLSQEFEGVCQRLL